MRTFRNLADLLIFRRIDRHRFQVNIRHRNQFQIAILAELIEIRLMLEIIRIQFFFRQRQIRLDVIGEFHDFQIHAVFLEIVFHRIQNFRMRHGRRADLQRDFLSVRRLGRRFFLVAAAASRQETECKHACRRSRCPFQTCFHNPFPLNKLTKNRLTYYNMSNQESQKGAEHFLQKKKMPRHRHPLS